MEKSLNIADDTSGLCSNANGILPFPNVPPHPAEIDSSDIAQRVVAKYCLQLAELSAPSCRPFESDQASKVESSKAVDARSSSVTTGGCATLGAAVRPEWINESCEVTQSIFSSTLKSVAKDACKIISTSAMSNASKCTDGVIPAVCKAVYDGASDLVSYLAKEAGETDPQPNELVLERLTNSFTSTVFACLSGLAKESIKKSIISGSSSTWARTIIGHEAAASILAKNGATVKVTGAALRKEALKQAGLALCSAGAKAVAKTLNSTPPKMFRSACGGSTESENQARLAACLLSTASACSAASGGVDFAAIIDVKEGASKLTADTISMAAMAGCGITGKVGGTACGVINEAA
ncbi:MAG: hypothetical protein NTV34_02645, partial [Proteobacteria bacterium]|nr:hypothetical protein [Pseudomonadota bacterium]